MFRDLPGFMDNGWSLKEFPQSDVIYNNDKTIVELPLAGYTREQLSVEVQEGHLVISATKCQDKGCSRLAARAFRRTLWIGDGHQLNELSATFRNGLLRVEIPRTQPEEPETIKVEIK
jgi:HSP20 family molecular chaperone IbpA